MRLGHTSVQFSNTHSSYNTQSAQNGFNIGIISYLHSIYTSPGFGIAKDLLACLSLPSVNDITYVFKGLSTTCMHQSKSKPGTQGAYIGMAND